MRLGRISPSRAARPVLCVAGGLVITVANRAAVHAMLGPFDGRFWLKTAVTALILLASFTLAERLLFSHSVRVNARFPFAAHTVFPPIPHRMFRAFLDTYRHACTWFAGLHVVVQVAAAGAVILLCWSPVIIMMFPGTLWYDTGDQIAQFFGISVYGQPAGAISSHHPVLDTIIFGGAAQLGDLLTGNYQNGLVAYLGIQVVVTAAELAVACLYVCRVGCPRVFAAVLFLFFALFPAFPIFTMSIVKDTLHVLFLIPWLLMVAEAIRTRLAALASRRFLIGLVIVSIGNALTTMTGLYITVLTLLCLPLLRACRRLRLAAAAAAATVALLAMVVFPAAVRGPLHVAREDANQLLVAPMQMTARYALDHPDDVTAYERGVIDRVNTVPFERMARRYNPYLADPVIQYALRDPSAVPEYLRVWLSMGLRHPESYIAAFISLESGWFSFTRTPLDTTDRGISLATLNRHAHAAIGNRMWFQIANAYSDPFTRMPPYAANRAGQSAAYVWWDMWRAAPVLNVLTFTALWTFVLPLFLVFAALGRRGAAHGDIRETAETIEGCDEAQPGGGVAAVRGGAPAWAPFLIPLVWSLLSLLPNAISIPLKPTATRYMMWALVMVPLLLALLRADTAAPATLWGSADAHREEETCRGRGARGSADEGEVVA